MFTFPCSFMWRIPTVNSHLTLDQHLKQHSINTLIDTWSTLNWRSIGLLMINRWSTLDQCLLDSWQSIYQLICIDWHSIVCLQKLFDSQLTVDLDVKWMLTKYWWRCWWSVDRRLSQDYWLTRTLIFFSSHDLNTNHKSWAWKLEQSFLWVEVMML